MLYCPERLLMTASRVPSGEKDEAPPYVTTAAKSSMVGSLDCVFAVMGILSAKRVRCLANDCRMVGVRSIISGLSNRHLDFFRTLDASNGLSPTALRRSRSRCHLPVDRGKSAQPVDHHGKT